MSRLHRFYTGPDIKLTHDFWLHDEGLLWQWRKVLRYKIGQEVVLFDGVEHERLYKIAKLDEREARLELVTEYKRKLPPRDIYLAWALLKKDKNDWVLQKATELGANHFIPLTAERSEKTGFNLERANKIIIEAAEQCGRGNIPSVREPLDMDTLISEFKGKVPIFVCEESGSKGTSLPDRLVLLVGPEGGWSAKELDMFAEAKLPLLGLAGFTLRAETAAITALSSCVATA